RAKGEAVVTMIRDSSVSVNASLPVNFRLRTSFSPVSQLVSCAKALWPEKKSGARIRRARVHPRCFIPRVFGPTARLARSFCQAVAAPLLEQPTEPVVCAGLRVAPDKKRQGRRQGLHR